MRVQIEQTGSWGPFPLPVSQRGVGGAGFGNCKGAGLGRSGVGEERGRSCPTVGNNGGAAFWLGVREEAGCWRGKRGGEPRGGGLLHTPPHLPKALGGWGHFALRSRMEEGRCHSPKHSSSPWGAPSLEISGSKSWVSSCCQTLGTESPGIGWGH